MSAIFGILSLDGSSIRKEASFDFRKGYQTCNIDRYEEAFLENGFMGCGIQYFTKESSTEVLPFRDEKNQILFTTDCVLDNRDFLLKALSLQDSSIPDGALLYHAYLTWGKACVEKLRGSFSFAVYHWDTQELTLYADHFASRCLFFHVREHQVIFSTLLMPMIQASGFSYHLNERWLTDSISLLTPVIMHETRECAYQDVFKVDSGHYVTIKPGQAPQYHCYYNPLPKCSVDAKMTSAQCKEALHNTLYPAVKNCLRSSGEIGIQLSSGLDSATIACIAAPLLKEHQKNLFSFTSIPSKDSPKRNHSYFIDDESEGVMKIVTAYPNIIPSFLACEGKNILSEGKRLVRLWELPCKSGQNAVWIDEIYHEAREKGCRILLSGATGNCTLSAGSVIDTAMDFCRHGHLIKGFRLFTHFCHRYHINRKKVFRKQITAYRAFLKEKWHLSKPAYLQTTLVKPALLQKYDFQKRIWKQYLLQKPWNSFQNQRSYIYFPNAYAQLGEIETKLSLAHGILPRDPLRNVEFVEFCMKLPIEYFANADFERRLVREYMQGIVPYELCIDLAHRGQQSSDQYYRIQKDWHQYEKLLKDLLFSDLAEQYFDSDKLHSTWSCIQKSTLYNFPQEVQSCIDVYLFFLYLEILLPYTEG